MAAFFVISKNTTGRFVKGSIGLLYLWQTFLLPAIGNYACFRSLAVGDKKRLLNKFSKRYIMQNAAKGATTSCKLN